MKHASGRLGGAVTLALSLCASLALTMTFAVPQLPVAQVTGPLAEIVWNLYASMGAVGVNSTLLLVVLAALGLRVRRFQGEGLRPPKALLPVSVAIALVWLLGASFRIDNTLHALTASPGQIVKSVIYLIGSAYTIRTLGALLFCLLERQSEPALAANPGVLARLYRAHPFAVTLPALLICWSPHVVISFPGHIGWDPWSQLAQFFGASPFTTHHPPVHTALLGTFVDKGVQLGSAGIGLFAFILAQTMFAACVVAYALSLMKSWGAPLWLRIGAFAVAALSPHYTNFITVAIKDTPYSFCLLLFVLEILCMLDPGSRFFSSKKHALLLFISVAGALLTRHNGKHVLYPTAALLVICFASSKRAGSKKTAVRCAACLLAPMLAAGLANAVVMAHYGVTQAPGAVRESLSLPFQQTARYVSTYPEDVTPEEAEAIAAVLDYEHLAQLYDPAISDPVKATFNAEATGEDLLRYLRAWLGMFAKHPGVYFEATLNQNYHLLYPFDTNNTFDMTVIPQGEEAAHAVNVSFGSAAFHNTQALAGAKSVLKGVYGMLSTLPVISLLCHPAPYCIALILLTLFCARRTRRRLLLALCPLLLSTVVVVLSPVIRGSVRYFLPVVYAMPAVLAYYMRMAREAR